jgi:hypothetical protein
MLACASGNVEMVHPLLGCRRRDRISGQVTHLALPDAVNTAGDTALIVLCSQPPAAPPVLSALEDGTLRLAAGPGSARAELGRPAPKLTPAGVEAAAGLQWQLSEAASAILRAGGSLEHANRLGETALHCAAARGHSGLVEALVAELERSLSAGRSRVRGLLSAVDAHGKTPAALARAGQAMGIAGCARCLALLDAAVARLQPSLRSAGSALAVAEGNGEDTDEDYEYVDGDGE